MKRRAKATLLFLTLGCGSGAESAPDLSGMYAIVRHTISRAEPGGAKATCSAEGAAVMEKPYLRVWVDDMDVLRWALCDKADVTTCQDEAYGFAKQRSDRWEIRGATAAAYFVGCTLYHAEGSARREGAAGVRLEVKVWNEARDVPLDRCTLDAAEDLGKESECDEHEVVVAASLQ